MPDLSYCGQQVRRLDNDRFLCTLFAPPERREALFALYAFNLELEAIPGKVTEPLLGQMRYQWWREALDGAASGTSHHQVMEPLARAIDETGLDKACLHALIDARAADLDGAPIADWAAFGTYAATTAGALGEMSLDVLGIDDAGLREAARHVGKAVAAVDILHSLSRVPGRRLCLPRESMTAAGLSGDAVFDGSSPAAVRRVVAEVVDWAARHLSAARLDRGSIRREALPALLPAVLADSHVKRLRRADFDPFDRHLRLPTPWRIVGLWLRARRNRF